MGEVIEFDERGRLTIPLEFRHILRGSRVMVERGDDNTILIRADFDSEALLKNIRAIRLKGDGRLSAVVCGTGLFQMENRRL